MPPWPWLSAGQILGVVLRRGLLLIAAGIGLGVLAGPALTRLMASELWGVSASDPWTFTAVAALLAAAGLAASSIRAHRATQVDPDSCPALRVTWLQSVVSFRSRLR